MATTTQTKGDCAAMAARIDRLTTELDCTQAELAEVLEVGAVTISRYKSGRSPWPAWVVLRVAICESRLGLDPVQRDIITLNYLRPTLESIARKTLAGAERLIRRERLRRRVWR